MDNLGDRRVHLQINGPLLIEGGSVRVTTAVNRTWGELLNGELRLNLPDGVRVSTSQFRRQTERRGWSASLDEEVGDFVDRFQGRRTFYNVYLCNQTVIQARRRRYVRDNARRPMPNLQAVIRQRLRNFNPNFLRLVRREIDNLRRRGLWRRNVMHAPLACYFLEDLVRDITA